MPLIPVEEKKQSVITTSNLPPPPSSLSTTTQQIKELPTKPITVFNKSTGQTDTFYGTLEEYNKKKLDASVKKAANTIPPWEEKLSISDFTNRADVQTQAQDVMNWIDKTTYEDGEKAVDAWINYVRKADYNITVGTKRLLEYSLGKGKFDRSKPETLKAFDSFSRLLNEWESRQDDGKYKYENMGFKENMILTGDILKGIFTDPWNYAVALTLGTTAPEKAAAQAVLSTSLKQTLKNIVSKSYHALPKIIYDPRKYSSTMPIFGIEGGLYAGTDNFILQKRYKELGVYGYEEYDLGQTAKAAFLGFGIGNLVGGATTGVVKHIDVRQLRKLELEDKVKRKEEAFKGAREREEFEKTVLGEPAAKEDIKLISVEEAAALNRAERERIGRREPTHIEDVADFEKRVANEEDLAKETIILDTDVARAKSGKPPKKKPTIGGARKSLDEATSTFLLYSKPTTYSKQVGEASDILAEQGGSNKAGQLLRYMRYDSLETIFDDVTSIAFDNRYELRSHYEQIGIRSGKYTGPLEILKRDLQLLARKDPRYKTNKPLVERKQWQLKDKTLLNDDLYIYMNSGRVAGGISDDIVSLFGQFRKIYDDIEKEVRQAGFVFHKVPYFFPRYLKEYKFTRATQQIAGNKQRLAKQLLDDGEVMTIDEGRQAVDNLLGKLADDFDPTVGSMGQRKYIKLNTIPIKDLYQTDVYATTWVYANSMMKKVVRKENLGFTKEEFDNKWLIPIFGGTLNKTSIAVARGDITEKLIALGFTKDFVESKVTQRFIEANFLARQGSELPEQNINTFITKEKLRSLRGRKRKLDAYKLTADEVGYLGKNNTLADEIDKLIRINFANKTFLKRSERVKGELDPENVNYKGTIRHPAKTLNHERKRIEKMHGYMVGTMGISDGKALKAFMDSLLAMQAGNKLGMATLSSFPEFWVPLIKTNSSVAMRAFWKTLLEQSKQHYLNVKNKSPGVFSLTREELNTVNKLHNAALSEAVQAMTGEGLSGLPAKFAHRFLRSIMLDQYTKYIQIYSYNAAKFIIQDNLKKLSQKANKLEYLKNDKTAMYDAAMIRQLGVNIDEGIKWYKEGRNIDTPFYETLKHSANRFVDEAVLIPSRETSSKFLMSSHTIGRVVFQLFSYPVNFSNTIVRNALREMYLSAGTRRHGLGTIPTTLATGWLMYYTAQLMTGIKTGGRSYEDDPVTLFWRTLDTVGVTGPFSLIYGFDRALQYRNLPAALARAGLGPTVGGLVGDVWTGKYPYSSFVKDTMPYRNVIKAVSPEALFEWDMMVRELEMALPKKLGGKGYGPRKRKQLLRKSRRQFELEQSRMGPQIRKRERKEEERKEIRDREAQGGLIKGPPVPFTKDNPADRVMDYADVSYNVAAGNEEPYDDQMERLGLTERVQFKFGGPTLTNKQLLALIKKRQTYLTDRQTEVREAKPTGYNETLNKMYAEEERLMSQQIAIERYQGDVVAQAQDWISWGLGQVGQTKVLKALGKLRKGKQAPAPSMGRGPVIEGEFWESAEKSLPSYWDWKSPYTGETPLFPSVWEEPKALPSPPEIKLLEERALDLGVYGEYNKFIRNIQTGQEKGTPLQLLRAATGKKAPYSIPAAEQKELGLYDIIRSSTTEEAAAEALRLAERGLSTDEILAGKFASRQETMTKEELLELAEARIPRFEQKSYYPAADEGGYIQEVDPIDPIGGEDHSIFRTDEIFEEITQARASVGYTRTRPDPYTHIKRDIGQEILHTKLVEEYNLSPYESITEYGAHRAGIPAGEQQLDSTEAINLFDETVKNKTPDELMELAEKISILRFSENPYIHIRPDPTEWAGRDFEGLGIYGNEDVGWSLYDMNNPQPSPIVGVDTTYLQPLSDTARHGDNEAAQFTLQNYIREQGFDDERQSMQPSQGRDMGTLPNPQDYEEFLVKEDQYSSTYQTKGYTQDPQHWRSEYEAENTIGWSQLSTRTLADGTQSHHAEAIQSDLHQAADSPDSRGRRTGYKSDRDRDEQAVIQHLEEGLEDFDIVALPIHGFEETSGKTKYMFKGLRNLDKMKNLVKDIIVDESLEGDMRQANIDSSFAALKVSKMSGELSEKDLIGLDRWDKGVHVSERLAGSMATEAEEYAEVRKDYDEADFKKLARKYLIRQAAEEILSAPTTRIPLIGETPGDRFAIKIPVNNRYYYDLTSPAIPDLPMKGGEWRKSIWRQSINHGLKKGLTKFSWSPAWIQEIHWIGYGEEEKIIHKVADEDLTRLSKKLALEYGGKFTTEQIVITKADVASGKGGMDEDKIERVIQAIWEDSKKGEIWIKGLDIGEGIKDTKVDPKTFSESGTRANWTEILINVPTLDLTGKAAEKWLRLGYALAKGGLVGQMDRLGFAGGDEVDWGSTMYKVYQKSAEKIGITKEETARAYTDSFKYVDDYFKTRGLEYVDDYDRSRREDINEIFVHGLSGYRIGDTKIKRAAYQSKDLMQAATHFMDKEDFQNEYGDYINNKVGFYLRDTYGDDEEVAMKSLGKMIDNKDERLHFLSEELEE